MRSNISDGELKWKENAEGAVIEPTEKCVLFAEPTAIQPDWWKHRAPNAVHFGDTGTGKEPFVRGAGSSDTAEGGHETGTGQHRSEGCCRDGGVAPKTVQGTSRGPLGSSEACPSCRVFSAVFLLFSGLDVFQSVLFFLKNRGTSFIFLWNYKCVLL